MGKYSKEQTIELIIDELNNNNSIPSVSLGNGGAGYENIMLDGEAIEAFRRQLEEAEYAGEATPADDFADFCNVADFAHCVEFVYPDGMRQQFLLADD